MLLRMIYLLSLLSVSLGVGVFVDGTAEASQPVDHVGSCSTENPSNIETENGSYAVGRYFISGGVCSSECPPGFTDVGTECEEPTSAQRIRGWVHVLPNYSFGADCYNDDGCDQLDLKLNAKKSSDGCVGLGCLGSANSHIFGIVTSGVWPNITNDAVFLGSVSHSSSENDWTLSLGVDEDIPSCDYYDSFVVGRANYSDNNPDPMWDQFEVECETFF